MNEELTYHVLQSCLNSGVAEFVVCAGSRNSSFVAALRLEQRLTTYYWPEERSAAFFALGRSKLTNRPLAIVTTSGTAAGELLPATMEAFYSGTPLILITADRPQVFRGSGAPQSAEQVGLFGHYVQFCLDIADPMACDLKKWLKKSPIHLNVCLEEPQRSEFKGADLYFKNSQLKEQKADFKDAENILNHFLTQVDHPIAIVSTLRSEAKEHVAHLLQTLQIPIILEGISGLREDSRLQKMRIHRTDKVLENAGRSGYSIDGVLRIGGIPTHRIWRDLEYLEDELKVCSLSELPFSGLSWTRCVAEAPLDRILKSFIPSKQFKFHLAEKWLNQEEEFKARLVDLFEDEKEAEPSLIHELSKKIPHEAHIYLGNSLPIRQWDMAAVSENKNWVTDANRGVNGIDGQVSTFLGLSRKQKDNWGIFGDLTLLYDMAGFWILPKLKETPIKIVVINNAGGKIFERMYPYKEMLNEHQLSFKPLAALWKLDYICLNTFQDLPNLGYRQFIEVVPDEQATARFWSKLAKIDQKYTETIACKECYASLAN